MRAKLTRREHIVTFEYLGGKIIDMEFSSNGYHVSALPTYTFFTCSDLNYSNHVWLGEINTTQEYSSLKRAKEVMKITSDAIRELNRRIKLEVK